MWWGLSLEVSGKTALIEHNFEIARHTRTLAR